MVWQRCQVSQHPEELSVSSDLCNWRWRTSCRHVVALPGIKENSAHESRAKGPAGAGQPRVCSLPGLFQPQLLIIQFHLSKTNSWSLIKRVSQVAHSYSVSDWLRRPFSSNLVLQKFFVVWSLSCSQLFVTPWTSTYISLSYFKFSRDIILWNLYFDNVLHYLKASEPCAWA